MVGAIIGCQRSISIEFLKIVEEGRVGEMKEIRLQLPFFSPQRQSLMHAVCCKRSGALPEQPHHTTGVPPAMPDPLPQEERFSGDRISLEWLIT